MLPPLRGGQAESCLHLRCAPSPTPTSRSTKHTPSPRLYDIPPDTQMLCINIRASSIINFPFDEAHGTLYVPARALLAAISDRCIAPEMSNESTRIPWDEWAKHTSWVDTRGFRTNNERYMFGQRTVAFNAEPELPGEGYNAIVLLDFDERRVNARRAEGPEAAREVYTPQATEVDSYERLNEVSPTVYDSNCGQGLFEGGCVPSRNYVKTTIGLPPSHLDMYNSIMMDNEHGADNPFIHVYHD
jgi:hypothetical protein